MNSLLHSFGQRRGRYAGTFVLLFFVLSFWQQLHAQSATNNVTGGNGIDYTINGQADPTLTLLRGVTYVFKLSGISFHPFYIKTSLGSGSTGAYNTGVTGNGATSGNLTIVVDSGTPNTLLYQCGAHSPMNGVLNIVTPAAPPTVKVVYVNVGPFVTMKSTGTNGNGWSVVPEFRCGTAGTNWTSIVNFTNSFASGTNTTTFPRLDVVCGSTNVLLRIRNQAN